jgi:muramoyltetrapeptide carboxypeptidase
MATGMRGSAARAVGIWAPTAPRAAGEMVAGSAGTARLSDSCASSWQLSAANSSTHVARRAARASFTPLLTGDPLVRIVSRMLSQPAPALLDFIAPPALHDGDLVAVIAPSGPFDRTLFWRGLGWLGEHFRLRFESDIFAREGFVAGTRERRRDELNRALACDEARAIVCARGGYGATEIATSAAFTELRKKPKWLIGFSDITTLHVEAQRQGVMSLHAHNVTGLGPGDAAERESWLGGVRNAGRSAMSYTLERQDGPVRRGLLMGGNLTLIHHAALTGRFRPPPGALLFLEEVSEAPYRLARLLSGLEAAGTFDSLSALVIGQITAAGRDRYGVTPFEVFSALAERHGLTLGWGLAAGHARPNAPLLLGAPAVLAERCLTVG